MNDNIKRAEELNSEMETIAIHQRLELISRYFPDTVFTTSLGPEDQFITHLLAKYSPDTRIVTLQTGRLFAETLDLLEETKTRYKIEIEEIHPKTASVDKYVKDNGLNGFYESVEARHACCHIRKIEPLQRALGSRSGWITGLRREQSANRGDVAFAEWSDDYQLMKFNPLADLSLAQLNASIEQENIPVNALHKRGYPSIGCEPCTRAIKPGEPERAGRWWWEQEDKRECGLHVAQGN